VPDQQKNAGNDGDVMKHAPLQRVVLQRSKDKEEFWYLETHAGYPWYHLPPGGSWKDGIGHLNAHQAFAPQLLKDYLTVAFHDKQSVPDRFPDKRTYLGSAAQVFHLLREEKKRIRMTLFELDTFPAEHLRQYFGSQGAKTVLVRAGGDAGHVAKFLREWWRKAASSANSDDVVMIIQGDSYKLAPSLWKNSSGAPKPDLVFLDPFKLGDSMRQPHTILDSLDQASVAFICWTPLFCVPKKWNPSKWSFEDCKNQLFRTSVGNRTTSRFKTHVHKRKGNMAWLSWKASSGNTRDMYGCQLTFGNIFRNFTPADVWEFGQNRYMPYLDSSTWNTSWRSPDPSPPTAPAQSLSPGAQQPGQHWWDKYHAAYWWP